MRVKYHSVENRKNLSQAFLRKIEKISVKTMQ